VGIGRFFFFSSVDWPLKGTPVLHFDTTPTLLTNNFQDTRHTFALFFLVGWFVPLFLSYLTINCLEFHILSFRLTFSTSRGPISCLEFDRNLHPPAGHLIHMDALLVPEGASHRPLNIPIFFFSLIETLPPLLSSWLGEIDLTISRFGDCIPLYMSSSRTFFSPFKTYIFLPLVVLRCCSVFPAPVIFASKPAEFYSFIS